MALFETDRNEAALERVLDHERQLILAGKLQNLPKVGEEKERLLTCLRQTTGDQNKLNRLRQKADRNQQLLAAVARGLKAVSVRLDTLKSRRSQLNTYDRGGQRADLMPPRSSFERRA